MILTMKTQKNILTGDINYENVVRIKNLIKNHYNFFGYLHSLNDTPPW